MITVPTATCGTFVPADPEQVTAGGITYTSEVLKLKNVSGSNRGTTNSSVSDQVAATLACTTEMMKKKTHKKAPVYERQNVVEIPLVKEEKEGEEAKKFLESNVFLEGEDGILTICHPNGSGGLEVGMAGKKSKAPVPPRKRKIVYDSSDSETSPPRESV